MLSRTFNAGGTTTRRVDRWPRLDLLQQQQQALPADLVEVLVDRRERWREELRLGDVVEADDAHFARHVTPGLVHGPQHPQRHLVVGGEDRGRVPHAGEALAELVARARAPVAGQQRRRVGARRRERGHPAVHALLRLEPVRRPREMPDRAMTELEQMPRRGLRARHLVDGDHRHRLLRPGLHGHHGQLARQVRERLRRTLLRRDQQHAVDALAVELVDGAQHEVTIKRGDADDAHEVALGVRGALDPEQRRGRPEQRGVEAHHAERPGAPRDQRTGE